MAISSAMPAKPGVSTCTRHTRGGGCRAFRHVVGVRRGPRLFATRQAVSRLGGRPFTVMAKPGNIKGPLQRQQNGRFEDEKRPVAGGTPSLA